MSHTDLRDVWSDLLRRRADLAGTLDVYGELIEHWARLDPPGAPLAWTAAECRDRWHRGVPLLAEARPAWSPETIEDLVAPVMAFVGGVRPDATDALGRFADAWDHGTARPESLYPTRGRWGTLDDAVGLDESVVAFLAIGTLRPVLERYFTECRRHLADHDWGLGICPLCGAPAGFSDVIEDGRRRLACHLCGAGWIFTRLRCPYCGTEETKDLARLDPEALTDQGYFVCVCNACRGYLKELDRRVRWNAGPPLVEDWGSPHFDVIARRAGYWRPAPPLILGPPDR
jgi:FdhE protein